MNKRIIHSLLVLTLLACASAAVAEDFEALKASVVKVTAEYNGKRKTGTGFIVKVEADAVFIATASHVIEGDQAPQVEFFVQRNRPLPAEVARSEGGDPKGLALLVLRGKAPAGLAPVALAPEASAGGGDAVATIGFGRGQGDWGVIRANVASFDGRDLKLDGSIKEGNSGGPVLKGGAVVGLITSIDRDFALATPVQVVHSLLVNWGVTPAVAARAPQADTRAAAEEVTTSQVNALNAIAQALEEQVTKPIAAQTAAAPPAAAGSGASMKNLQWFAGKWDGFARTKPGHVAGNASYVEIAPDGSFRMSGYWVGTRQGKLRLEDNRITYETANNEAGSVAVTTDAEGADMLVFDNVTPAANAGVNASNPLWVEVKRTEK